MERRSVLLAATLVSIWAGANMNALGAQLATIGVGPWLFDVPSDWKRLSKGNETPYLEANDGTMGCYLKAITFGKSRRSAEEAARFVQGIHEELYLNNRQANWRVVNREFSTAGPDVLSAVDFFDEKKEYRVLSLVLATARDAAQLTIHDYKCENYEASVKALEPIARSLRRGSHAA